jgi:hypothetical protein
MMYENTSPIAQHGTSQPSGGRSEEAYDSLDLVRTLLAEYPDLLFGQWVDESPPSRWLLASRELGAPGGGNGFSQWSLDHLLLDQDAVPTLVKVEQNAGTSVQREAVGHMLDCAANAAVYWPAETIRARFEATCESQGVEPFRLVADLIRSDSSDDGDIESFWHHVKTNLQSGRIRLILVADRIPTELKRIVEFLNEQMDPAQVLAVEITRYAGRGLRTFIPCAIGRTAGSECPERKQWDERSFFQALETRRGIVEAVVARRILEWAKAHMPSIWWGEDKRNGSFVPGLRHNGIWHQVIEVRTNGNVEIQFQYMQANPPFDDHARRLDLLHRLNEMPGIALAEDSITRRPSVPLFALKYQAVLKQFVGVLEWVVQEIEAT